MIHTTKHTKLQTIEEVVKGQKKLLKKIAETFDGEKNLDIRCGYEDLKRSKRYFEKYVREMKGH